MDKDELYMQRCLQLAQLGAGNVAPNPMVGAVLVHDEKIIGEGYHQKFGEAHAEVYCLNNVNDSDKHLIKKSTLYVSLEPCDHFGKTPPCTGLIISNKIPKVVIGCKDVYKEVNGKGIKKLQNAGVEVFSGILENECIELNKRFFTYHQHQRPYIILKWAQSSNAKIGEADKRVFISNELTNRLVHKWRGEEAAIMVGTNTAAKDNPELSTRLWKGNNPVRLVLDMNLRLPDHLKIFNKETKTIIFNRIKNEEEENNILYKVEEENIVPGILNALHKLQIQSVLIEGGSKLLQSFIDAGLWDEARIITNENLIIENGINAPKLSNAVLQSVGVYNDDTIRCYNRII